MAIDTTPPRLKLIVTIAVIVVVTLVGLDFVLKSYYAYMSDDAARGKLAPTLELAEQYKAEQTELTSAVMPIDKAMAEIASGTRAEIIAPKQSDDMGPMSGWTKLQKTVPSQPTPQRRHEMRPDGGEPNGPIVADAGVTTPAATDAGAPRPIVRDAGAQPKPGNTPPPAPAPKH